MTGNEKTAALIPSVGADGGQPPHNSTKQRIPHETCESNPPEENIEEMRERIRRIMLMYGKEASNRKQEIDRQHYTIPNQRPKDKHCGKI